MEHAHTKTQLAELSQKYSLMNYHQANAHETASCNKKQYCQYLGSPSFWSIHSAFSPKVITNVTFTEITPFTVNEF